MNCKDGQTATAANSAGLSSTIEIESRTIADLAGLETIIQVHLAKALQYRQKVDLM